MDRRKFIKGAAGAAVVAALPMPNALPSSDGIALKCIPHPKLASAYWPQTLVEFKRQITPINYQFEPSNRNRYATEGDWLNSEKPFIFASRSSFIE